MTDRVKAAVKSAADPAEAEKLRRAVMNTIEKESFDKTGLRSDVVTLYHGGLYHLYRYKKYTDVRLVFSPEQDIAFFGGDPDNFEYPRYDLDICFFRVYENGKPAQAAALSEVEPGEPARRTIWCSSPGNPGHTERMLTRAAPGIPPRLRAARRGSTCCGGSEVLLTSFSQRSVENARRARDMLLGCQNSRKARLGGLAGLQDPAVMARKRAEEEALRRAAAGRPELAADCDAAFKTIDESLDVTPRSATNTTCWKAARRSTAGCSPSPARWSAWPRNCPSPTPTGCASTAIRTWIRSRRACFPRRRSTTTWKRCCWPTRLSMYLEQNGCRCGGATDWNLSYDGLTER